ncbi:hypothetical protein ACFLZM_05935 [Thermodesulfobacteriota bacterium]
MAWKRVATKEQCTRLFTEAGLQQISCEPIDHGYVLRHASEWWDIIWYGGFRGLMKSLSQDELIQFKAEHFAEVNEMVSDNGIWFEMTILYTLGTKHA